MIAVVQHVVVWESVVVVAGGLVAGAVGLSVLAKVPGGRWLFRRLVSDPIRDIVRAVVDAEVDPAVERSVAAHLTPIEGKIDQINHAVNNVGPGAPVLKERVGNLERGQEEIHGQLVIVRDMLKELVGR